MRDSFYYPSTFYMMSPKKIYLCIFGSFFIMIFGIYLYIYTVEYDLFPLHETESNVTVEDTLPYSPPEETYPEKYRGQSTVIDNKWSLYKNVGMGISFEYPSIEITPHDSFRYEYEYTSFDRSIEAIKNTDNYTNKGLIYVTTFNKEHSDESSIMTLEMMPDQVITLENWLAYQKKKFGEYFGNPDIENITLSGEPAIKLTYTKENEVMSIDAPYRTLVRIIAVHDQKVFSFNIFTDKITDPQDVEKIIRSVTFLK